jgi:hypothetical protein
MHSLVELLLLRCAMMMSVFVCFVCYSVFGVVGMLAVGAALVLVRLVHVLVLVLGYPSKSCWQAQLNHSFFASCRGGTRWLVPEALWRNRCVTGV